MASQSFSSMPAVGVVTDMNRQVLSPEFALGNNLGRIAEDGSTWVEVSTAGARSITFDPRTQIVTIAPVQPFPFVGLRTVVSSCWLNGSVLLPNTDRDLLTGDTDLLAYSVDPFTTRLCEPQFTLEITASQSVWGASVATNDRVGGDRALLVWAEGDFPLTASRIVARAFTASGGLVEDLGGGCGLGGEAFASCARPDHAFFTLRDRHEIDIVTRGVLLISPSRVDARCGPCRLVPDPAFGVSVIAGTGITPFKQIPVPMPAFA